MIAAAPVRMRDETALRAPFWLAALLLIAAMLHAAVYPETGDPIADVFYLHQDFYWVLGIAALAIAAPFAPQWLSRDGQARDWLTTTSQRRAYLVVTFAAVAVTAFMGRHLLMFDYSISRDEVMVDFDASIFTSLRLQAPVAAEWRDYFRGLGTIYMQPVAAHAAWASQYLPVNAALRAIAGGLGSRALEGAALAVLTLACVYSVARKLFAQRVDAALLAVLLTALSPQFLLTAMTPFAMSAHLALNMLWLALFLRGDGRGRGAAILVGFFATGLHQFVFHPVFVAPFVLQLFLQKRTREAVQLTLAYAAICAFWTQYPVLLQYHFASADQAASMPGLLARVRTLLEPFDGGELRVMVRNLLRFVSWQHLMLLPLFIAGCARLRRADPVLMSLAAGMALTTAIAFVLMPYQSYGWGYRYLHGFIGAAALLASYGYVELSGALSGAAASRLRTACVVATMLTATLLLPSRLWQARQTAEPYATAFAFVRNADADVVLIDPTGHRMAVDLVRNEPDLDNRPVLLDLKFLQPGQARRLCERYRVRVFTPELAQQFDLPAMPSLEIADRMAATVREELRQAHCDTPLASPETLERDDASSNRRRTPGF